MPFSSLTASQASFLIVMGNSHGSRPRKKPDLEGNAAITEPLQKPEPTASPEAYTPYVDSVRGSSTEAPGTEAERPPSRPNSLEILIMQAFKDYVCESEIDPKFGGPRQRGQVETDFELSELPVESQEDVF